MVAVMEREIQPEGVGHDLLLIWAPWARDDNDGRESWSVKPRVQSAYKGDPPDQYWVVDKIVGPHRRDRDDYWQLVSRHYLGEMTYRLMARDMQKPEWWVRSMLCWACELTRREYVDRTVR